VGARSTTIIKRFAATNALGILKKENMGETKARRWKMQKDKIKVYQSFESPELRLEFQSKAVMRRAIKILEKNFRVKWQV